MGAAASRSCCVLTENAGKLPNLKAFWEESKQQEPNTVEQLSTKMSVCMTSEKNAAQVLWLLPIVLAKHPKLEQLKFDLPICTEVVA